MSTLGDSHGRSAALDFIRSPALERRDLRSPVTYYYWFSGDDQVPSVAANQPFEPEIFFRLRRIGHDSTPTVPDLFTSTNRRYQFWFRGVWPAIPPDSIWQTAATMVELRAGLPRRPIIDRFGDPDVLLDFSFPFFLLGPRLPIVFGGTRSGVPINAIEGASMTDPGTWRFDRLIDFFPGPVGSGINSGLDATTIDNLIAGPGELGPLNAGLITNAPNFDGSLLVARRNSGCSVDHLTLPGLPNVDTPFKMGWNGGFLGSYASTDTTPLKVIDNNIPFRCQ